MNYIGYIYTWKQKIQRIVYRVRRMRKKKYKMHTNIKRYFCYAEYQKIVEINPSKLLAREISTRDMAWVP